MPAKIVVLSGADQGKEMWVEKVVARIGRHPSCEMVLTDPHLPEHALTLEFRDGNYTLYSRLGEPVNLAGRALPARGFDRWPGGKDLHLPGPVILRLEVERDPRPAPRPRPSPALPFAAPPPVPGAPESAAPEDPASQAQEAKKARSRQLTQLLVILLCAAAGVFFFLAEEEGNTGTTQTPTAHFQSLVKEMHEKKKDEPRYQDLRQALQSARTAELRGNKKSMLEQYKKLRDQLVAWKSASLSESKEDTRLINSTLQFITNRLDAATKSVK